MYDAVGKVSVVYLKIVEKEIIQPGQIRQNNSIQVKFVQLFVMTHSKYTNSPRES